MEIYETIMETFTLGTAIGLNMTHNASFCAESVNAAEWNRASGYCRLALIVVSAGA